MKWIIYVLLAWLVWHLLRRWQDKSPTAAAEKEAERMVRCLACGLNLPESEAIADRNGFYCSAAHQKSAAGQGDHSP